MKAIGFNLSAGPVFAGGFVVAAVLALVTGGHPGVARVAALDRRRAGGTMNPLRQVWIATALALQALPQRLGPAIVTMIGVATVVAVMVSILAIGAGVRRFIDVTDQPERAVVLSAASPSEFAGAFDAGQVAIIGDAPGVKRLPNGQLMVQPLSATPVLLIRKADGVPGYGFLRGAEPADAGDEQVHAAHRRRPPVPDGSARACRSAAASRRSSVAWTSGTTC